MRARLFLVGALLSLLALSANARDYGRWLCSDCFSPNASAPATVNMGEVTIFLRSNQITERWQPNDTIQVCDGVWCAVIIWQTTVWAPFGGVYSDTRAPYKNQTSGGSYGGNTPLGFRGGYTITAYGHNEWWDYYSDGVYIGSSEVEFVIDYFVASSSIAQVFAAYHVNNK